MHIALFTTESNRAGEPQRRQLLNASCTFRDFVASRISAKRLGFGVFCVPSASLWVLCVVYFVDRCPGIDDTTLCRQGNNIVIVVTAHDIKLAPLNPRLRWFERPFSWAETLSHGETSVASENTLYKTWLLFGQLLSPFSNLVFFETYEVQSKSFESGSCCKWKVMSMQQKISAAPCSKGEQRTDWARLKYFRSPRSYFRANNQSQI